MNPSRTGLTVLVLVLLATPATAHVPSFPTDNTAPERAVAVPDAVKSWSFYDRLDPGQVRYYRFSLAAGDRLRVSAFTPSGGAFTPSIALMSPALNASDPVPPGVVVPDGMGVDVVDGERPATATYELFAPSANYHTADVDRTVASDCTYLVAIYEPANRSGPVGVAVGSAEEFSPAEYVTVPFDLVRTHLWEGQHPLVAVGPWLLTLVAGAAVASRRWRDGWGRDAVRIALVGGGLLVAATGVNTLVQMAIALSKTGPTAGALVTSAFVVVPLLCGGWVLWVATRDSLALSAWTRVGLAVAAAASLVTWAGFILGPVALFALALLPARFLRE